MWSGTKILASGVTAPRPIVRSRQPGGAHHFRYVLAVHRGAAAFSSNPIISVWRTHKV
jgi:hypothetical protein